MNNNANVGIAAKPQAPIKVLFLTFYWEAWDALAAVHKLMLDDDRFDVHVIAIPRKLTGDEAFDDASSVHQFLLEAGVEHEVLNPADSWAGNARIKALAPDYTFVNYPWRRNYQPGYRPEELAKFTRIAYVPYFSQPLTNEPGDQGVAPYLYTQRTHQIASLIFSQDSFTQRAFAQTARGNSHVHFTGSPKIDYLLAEPEAPKTDEFTIVWAPHHSYSQHWLNFGVFAQMYQAMLVWASQHPEVRVVLRPHPFLFGTLVERNVVDANDLDAWLAAWRKLPNTSIDEHSTGASLMHSADIMITDGISFLAEYPLATGKPAIYLENQGHWDFSPIGELAAAANVCLSNFDEFVAGYEFIREAGLPDRAAEIEALRQAACPYPGKTAERIVELVIEHASSGPGGSLPALIDPTEPTDLAWEFQPGREPQVD